MLGNILNRQMLGHVACMAPALLEALNSSSAAHPSRGPFVCLCVLHSWPVVRLQGRTWHLLHTHAPSSGRFLSVSAGMLTNLAALLQTPKLGGRSGRLQVPRPAAEDAPSRGQPPPSPAGLDFVQHALDATPPLDADKVRQLADSILGKRLTAHLRWLCRAPLPGLRPLFVADLSSRRSCPRCAPAAHAL